MPLSPTQASYGSISISTFKLFVNMSKKQPTHCPLCFNALETRDVAPCWECGHLPEEIEHTRTGQHTYAEMRVFGELSAVLCDFCQVDFGSFDPTFFGLPRGVRIGYQKMQFIRAIENIAIVKDKYCPQCGYRLAFLQFVDEARQRNKQP